MINVTEILNKFNDEEKDYLVETMNFYAIIRYGNAPTTDEEFETWARDELAERQERRDVEQAKAQKKEDKRRVKAEKMGMTLEEYDAMLKREKTKRHNLKKLKEAEENLVKAQKAVARWKAKVEAEKED